MRLLFPLKESKSSSIKPMTPLKQVVAVNTAAAAKRKEEAPKESPPKASTVGVAIEEGKPSEAAGGGGDDGGAGKGEDGASAEADAVLEKLEGLSVGGDKA